jgi:hypothetical protein
MTTKSRPLILMPTILTLLLWGTHVYIRSIWDPGDPFRLAVTLLLVAAFAWVVFEHVKQLRGVDEYHKQVHCLALAIAYPCALVLLFALGFFRAEGLFQRGDSRDLPMILLLTYAIGLTIAFKRYQ